MTEARAGYAHGMQQFCSKRCSECRGRFGAARSAQGTQKVCGRPCRQRRRRRLARQRRARRVQDQRVDERERQRRCRDRRRSASEPAPTEPGPPACHAPASASKVADLAAKLLESWDRAVALSRASLERRMPAILRELAAVSGTSGAVTAAMSRASLAPDIPATP